jgi:hypothetical protein
MLTVCLKAQDDAAGQLWTFLRAGLRYRVVFARSHDELLLPCPFCGESARYEAGGGYIVCTGCGISTPDGLSEEMAIDIWHARCMEDWE